MIDRAGLQDQGLPATFYKITRPVSLTLGDAQVIATPANDFRVSFEIAYEEPLIGRQEAAFEVRPGIFRREIAPARTFALLRDVEGLRRQGLALGGSLQNALVYNDGVLEGGQSLRFTDECVRHKILDLLGDLALLGMPLQGHVHARFSGHAANVEFTRLLAKTERRMIMPHRYPFLLVDRITELEPGKRVVGLKNVSINEPFFQGHFPGHPIMPAVLIVEAMAQVGGVLLLSSVEDPRGKLVYFSGIDGARFRQPVLPGDQLRFELELIKLRGSLCKMRGTAWVGDALVAEADLMSTIVDT
jgi:UDP-3-O-[3-hydroxymyristoyl] N-acetylglucosamine deacetylase/3-hydroxyacyl-[acyl-carrier-protein] dehydratase